MLTPLVSSVGPPPSVDFSRQAPTVVVRLTNVNVGCATLVRRTVPPNLPVPLVPGSTQVLVESLEEFVDTWQCAHPGS